MNASENRQEKQGLLMTSSIRFGLIAAFLCISFGSSTAHAQVTREEIQRDRLERELRTEGQAVAVDGGVERAPCPLAGPQFADVKFTFSAAEFSGLDLIDSDIVAPAYDGLVGTEISVASICDIRDRAATILREAGYLASVQVPVQEIQGGRVKFDVVLARMTAVQIRGDAGKSGKALQAYIDKLAAQPVFNIGEAERYLLLARDIPGLDVRLVMQPAPKDSGARRGDVVGIFNVTRTPWLADATIQNLGSKAVGRVGMFGRVRLNGLTGLGDETILSAYATTSIKEQQVLQAGHEMRLGSEGFKLGGNLTFAWSRPDVPGDNLFESESVIGTLYGSYPFRRSQTANLYGSAGFEFIDQNIDFTGLPLSKDRLRIAYARLEFNSIDEPSLRGVGGYSSIEPRFGIAGALEVRQGFDVFGASAPCGVGFVNCTNPGVVPPSRLDGDPTAFVVRGEGQIDFRPAPLWLMSFKPRFQFSPDALFSYEQISGGNYTAGRGYDPGATIGDSGYGGQFELAYGSLVPETPGQSTFQPYAFFDFMAVSSKNIPGDPQTLTSIGGGLRSTLGEATFLDIVGAIPLEKAPFQTERGDFRLLATLSVQFGPKR